MLHIYNSLTRQKERFQPIEPNHVRMYVCGMTVYDYCHLGHARMLIVFDMVARYLKAVGYEVTYVRNITDIDDKIIARAQENGESIQALTKRFTQAMHEDEAALLLESPSHEPRATDNIPGMLNMIGKLIDKGLAYVGDNGDVYYSVNQFPSYGKLSGRKLEDLRAGERVSVASDKQDPLDFVLWKSAKPEEPAWDSPWGPGRPGWHIECSAMSESLLGTHFDIHGGGHDLQFPHHENEIAQSEGCYGHRHVNTWMHNGFIRVNDEKMSKSLGNFSTIRDVLAHYPAEVVRLYVLSSHYRSPLNFSDDLVDNAHNGLDRLYTALKDCTPTEQPTPTAHSEKFHQAMADDFNTAGAIAVLFDLAKALNVAKRDGTDNAGHFASELLQLSNILGLLQSEPEAWFTQTNSDQDSLSNDMIEALIAERAVSKAEKNWARADEIRGQLSDANIQLEDSAEGTTWRRG